MSVPKRKEITLKPSKEKFEVTGRPAGLARTHKIINTERAREVQFMKLCAQIHLDDFRHKRADQQRNDRLARRK